jgi:hypothetical protein
MKETIDQLRELLGEHNPDVVTVVQLLGLRETTPFGAMARTHEHSGDSAWVLLGPKDKLAGVMREGADGSVTFAITYKPDTGEVSGAPEDVASFGVRDGFIEVTTGNGVRVRLDAKTVREMAAICQVYPERLRDEASS